MPIPYRRGPGGSSSSVTIGSATIETVTNVNEAGGMQAPSKKTERGFSYDSFVQAEPKEISIEGWITPSNYGQLVSIRSAGEPVDLDTPTFASLSKAKVADISVTDDAEKISHFKISVQLTEVKEATTGTASLSVSSSSGEQQSSSADLENPTLVRSEETNGPSGGGFDPLGDIASWMGF